MSNRDPRVDAYIARSAPFARPILEHIRDVVHAACPDVEETIKWGFPNFGYKGMLCSMASFKEHCAFGFWQAKRVLGEAASDEEAMGSFGRLTSVKDLPPKRELVGYVKKAMQLNEEGIKRTPSKAKPKPPLSVPDDLAAALKKNRRASTAWEKLAPSHRREYVEWITEAKQPATRERRLATTLEWVSEGKSRNWKYERR